MKICIYGVIRSAFAACLLMNKSCIIASSIQEEKNHHLHENGAATSSTTTMVLRRRQEEDRIETGGKIPKMLALVCAIQGLASGHFFQETSKSKVVVQGLVKAYNMEPGVGKFVNDLKKTYRDLKANANEISEYRDTMGKLEEFKKLSEKLDLVEVRSPMGQRYNFAGNIAACARDLEKESDPSRRVFQNGGRSVLKPRDDESDVSRKEEYGKSSIITKIFVWYFKSMGFEDKRAYELGKEAGDNFLKLAHAKIFGNEGDDDDDDSEDYDYDDSEDYDYDVSEDYDY